MSRNFDKKNLSAILSDGHLIVGGVRHGSDVVIVGAIVSAVVVVVSVRVVVVVVIVVVVVVFIVVVTVEVAVVVGVGIGDVVNVLTPSSALLLLF